MKTILILSLLLTGCYTVHILETVPVEPGETNFSLAVTMKTAQGAETVSIATKSSFLCKWLQKNIKKYGSMAHVEAVGKCSKENKDESSTVLVRQP